MTITPDMRKILRDVKKQEGLPLSKCLPAGIFWAKYRHPQKAWDAVINGKLVSTSRVHDTHFPILTDAGRRALGE